MTSFAGKVSCVANICDSVAYFARRIHMYLLNSLQSIPRFLLFPDQTIRHSEPKNETQSCLVVFFIIYYSFLSGLIWFVILSFCWYLNYQKGRGDLTKLREYLRGKTAYFHLAAWSVPLVLCIIISGMSKVFLLEIWVRNVICMLQSGLLLFSNGFVIKK